MREDDDGGSATDQVAVIIAGNAAQQRGAGYWQTQYRPRPTAFTEARAAVLPRDRRLREHRLPRGPRRLDTVPLAFDILKINQNSVRNAIQKLDRELLAAWLNFANGAFDLTELVDTDGNGTPTRRSRR